ncbi:hypothetical protein GCM10007415_23780 [Parapedobacter pyrenivorans]|uniref:Uncharacterized protein n=1 Tax=Parapedobacter pyrenivorans TaxID=1305674 RepID=A0A917MB38_9SPHI|nr:hypothetical protein [Parapedobacter pyrenivorans]GGG88935.1 hypothetical protein GCM10007415_23780 [Parapedobacter pyrenivorans]
MKQLAIKNITTMQLELFITKRLFKDYINSFLEDNNLTLFFELKNNQYLYTTHLTNDKLEEKNLVVGIGTSNMVSSLKDDSVLDNLDPMSLVFVNYRTPSDPDKLVNFTVYWKTTNKDARKVGNMIKKSISKKFNKGVEVVDKTYVEYNRYLNEYYWSNDILTFKERLYKSGGIIQVQPI